MKLDKIFKKLNEIEQTERDKEQETTNKIEKLRDDLKTVIAKIEETYITGDVEQGAKLLTEKKEIESQITFLENFLKKRKEIVLINDDEYRSYQTDLNNELFNVYHEQKRKYESLLKDVEEIGSVMNNAIQTYQSTGTDLNRIAKKYGVPAVNNVVVTFNQHINRVISQYKIHTSPYLNSNDPQ